MRVIKTFFFSLALGAVPACAKLADGSPEPTPSDVKDCANLLDRMLDLPKEPSPM
jgi:hypothetical protein